MKHISILIPKGQSSLSNIEGSHQILTMVNNLSLEKGGKPFFDVNLVGLEKETPQANGLFKMIPEYHISEIPKTDLIIIPALQSEQSEALKMNRAFIPWIVDQYKNGAEVASLCVGAFLLAETGLLDGKECTTHWTFADMFREMYPQCNLVHENIMTDDDGIYTSGGAYAYLTLIMYLVEKYAGRELAILTSKMFSIDLDRNTQSTFIMFSGQKDHGDQSVIKVQDEIEKKFKDSLTVEELSDLVNVSRRSLERRFKKATHNTIVEYIQRVRVEAAKKELENSRKNISEVMYEVGYSDEKSFRNVFRKHAGLTPVDYKRKFTSMTN